MGEHIEGSIQRRKISRAREKTELDTSTGLSYNGTINPVPTNAEAPMRIERIFLREGERLSIDQKRSMVRHRDLVLKMTPLADQKKAIRQLERWAQEVEGKASIPLGRDPPIKD